LFSPFRVFVTGLFFGFSPQVERSALSGQLSANNLESSRYTS
jgi:hypothetical protein